MSFQTKKILLNSVDSGKSETTNKQYQPNWEHIVLLKILLCKLTNEIISHSLCMMHLATVSVTFGCWCDLLAIVSSAYYRRALDRRYCRNALHATALLRQDCINKTQESKRFFKIRRRPLRKFETTEYRFTGLYRVHNTEGSLNSFIKVFVVSKVLLLPSTRN